jgi:hypothetical protein
MVGAVGQGGCIDEHSESLAEHINTGYPANVCLIGTTLPNGYSQITPRRATA